MAYTHIQCNVLVQCVVPTTQCELSIILIFSVLPAVDNNWTRFVVLHHSPVEGQERRGIVRDPVVRPGREVEVSHFQGTL